MIRLAFFLVFLFLSVAAVSAQSRLAESEIVLHKIVELDFEPQQACFFVEFSKGDISRLRAVTLPLPTEDAALARRRWAVGALFRLPGGQEGLSYSLLVAGPGRNYRYFPPESLFVESLKSDRLEELPAMKEAILSRAAVLKSWRSQLSIQEENLRRLQEDADLIGDIGRIVDVKEEQRHLEAEYENLGRDIENLKGFLLLAKNHPEPQNFVRRELELTRQLGELAEVARKAEESEPARRVEQHHDSFRKQEIIEAARAEDSDSLQRRLVELRRRRMELEKKYGSVDRLAPPELEPGNFDVNAPL